MMPECLAITSKKVLSQNCSFHELRIDGEMFF